MLGAIDFRRLRQDGGAAVAHQNIGRSAQRRIGGDARIAVRAAALQRQHQFRCRHRFASCEIGGRQHVADHLDAGRDRLAGAAHILDRHGAEGVALGHPVGFLPAADLEHLAAETHHQHAGHVGIGRVAPLGALQDVVALALVVHGAAGAVHERDDAVDIGIVVEHAGAFDLARDEAGHRGRAIHAGEDGDIVARADLAVGAPNPSNVACSATGSMLSGARILGKAVVAREIVQHDVVLMQPFAGRDGFAGKADGLPELEDRLALGRARRSPSCGRAECARAPSRPWPPSPTSMGSTATTRLSRSWRRTIRGVEKRVYRA